MVLFALSCSKKDNENTMYFKDFPETYKTKLDPVDVKTYNPCQLVSIDKYLIIRNDCDYPLFQVLDIESNLIIAEFGKKGRGPNEIGNANIVITENMDTLLNLLIEDKTKRNYLTIDLLKSIETNNLEVIKKEKYPRSISRVLFTYYRNKKYLYYVKYTGENEGRLYIYDQETNKESVINQNNPDIGAYNLSATDYWNIYGFGLAYNSKNNKLALPSYYVRSLDFFTPIGEFLFSAKDKSYDRINMSFDNSKNISESENFGLNFKHITSSSEYIYLVDFNNMKATDFMNAPKGVANISVFNWQGKAICTYDIDRNVGTNIAVCEQHNKIYALCLWDEPINVLWEMKIKHETSKK